MFVHWSFRSPIRQAAFSAKDHWAGGSLSLEFSSLVFHDNDSLSHPQVLVYMFAPQGWSHQLGLPAIFYGSTLLISSQYLLKPLILLKMDCTCSISPLVEC